MKVTNLLPKIDKTKIFQLFCPDSLRFVDGVPGNFLFLACIAEPGEFKTGVKRKNDAKTTGNGQKYSVTSIKKHPVHLLHAINSGNDLLFGFFDNILDPLNRNRIWMSKWIQHGIGTARYCLNRSICHRIRLLKPICSPGDCLDCYMRPDLQLVESLQKLSGLGPNFRRRCHFLAP